MRVTSYSAAAVIPLVNKSLGHARK